MKIQVNGNTYHAHFDYIPLDSELDPGATIAHLRSGATEVAVGIAYKHSRDKFDKVTGRRIAFGRALQAAFPDKDDRRLAWVQYFWQVRDDSDNRLDAMLEQEFKRLEKELSNERTD